MYIPLRGFEVFSQSPRLGSGTLSIPNVYSCASSASFVCTYLNERESARLVEVKLEVRLEKSCTLAFVQIGANDGGLGGKKGGSLGDGEASGCSTC